MDDGGDSGIGSGNGHGAGTGGDPGNRARRRVTALWLSADAERRGRLADWLADAGYVVLLGEDPADAEPELALVDLTVSEAEGLRTMGRIRKRGRKISIVAVLPGDAPDLGPRADRALHRGAFDYVAAPVSRYRLLTTARNAAERTRFSRGLAAFERGDAPEPLNGIARTLAEIERDAIDDALARTGSDLDAVVRQLGIGRSTLYRKLKKYRLR